MRAPILLAVPNISEGRDAQVISAIGCAFASEQRFTGAQVGERGGGAADAPPVRPEAVRLLDVHSDRAHHRSVFTLSGPAGALQEGLLKGASVTVQKVDVMSGGEDDSTDARQPPHVGALDVLPIVYLDERARGDACAVALLVADRIGYEFGVPVFLYGELTATHTGSARTRAELRRGGVSGLRARMATPGRAAAAGSPTEPDATVAHPLVPDFGPPRMHPSAGATLVAARPPLVAFNLQLGPSASLADAQAIAALIREGGAEGLPGVRAIGVSLDGGVAQVSMNIERPFEVPLAIVVDAVGAHAQLVSAELVGLAPAAALEGFPRGLPMPGFDSSRQVIENALGC